MSDERPAKRHGVDLAVSVRATYAELCNRIEKRDAELAAERERTRLAEDAATRQCDQRDEARSEAKVMRGQRDEACKWLKRICSCIHHGFHSEHQIAVFTEIEIRRLEAFLAKIEAGK